MPALLPANLDRILTRTRLLVEIESPSGDAPGITRAAEAVQAMALAIDPMAQTTVHPSPAGPALQILFPGLPTAKPIMLLGHLDTVWPLGTLANMPYREAPDSESRPRIWGPGTLDMKCGIVMALEAISMVPATQRPPIILLLGQDEEVGSEHSRPLIESAARQCQAVFVLEPAQGISPAAYKTARKGVGNYLLEVTGIASHAGVDFPRGHSAILELARLLLKVATFTDVPSGLTVNPGVISGGTRSNVVAAHASAEIDVRIARLSDAPRLDALFQNLRCEDPACTLTISGGINRPPMERSEGTIRLFQLAKSLAANLGPHPATNTDMSFDLEEASTGGGSDGNFTAAIGVPTLDGMGCVVEGAHANNESVLIDHLIPRTTLLAHLLASLT